jgi:DNA-binding CsgD family transcriptional regulator
MTTTRGSARKRVRIWATTHGPRRCASSTAGGLTAAERDVGLLLLQGLRHKEIAHARRTSERTVRQQALSVYRKAGVEGRSELAGYFLDRLMRPGAPRGESA